MKKKGLVILALTAVLASTPVLAFGARSSSSSDGGGSSSSSSSTTTGSSTTSPSTVTVTDTGVKTTGATTSTDAKGSNIGVVVDAVTTTGQAITVNAKGEAVIGDTAVAFTTGGSATAGLPENVVSAINDINAGRSLQEVVKDVDLSGYNALTGTHAIITKDAATGAVKEGPVEVSLYVPNLVAGVENVSVLFYDNATGKWTLLPAVKVDPVTKTIAANVPGSGTLTVVYK